MAKATIRLVRSDGVEFNIDDKKWRLVDSIDGISAVNVELQTQNRLAKGGSIVTNQRTAAREVTFHAVNTMAYNRISARQEAVRFFNGEKEYSYVMYIEYQGYKRRMPCYIYKVEIPAINMFRTLGITCTMLGVDPYLTSPDNNSKMIGRTSGSFGFPYVSILGRGFTAGRIDTIKSVKVLNDGDAFTGYVLTLKALGDITNPIFKQDTHEFKVLETLHENDVMILDFEAEIPRVTKNGVNIIQKVSRNARFGDMGLKIGETLVMYSAEQGEENMQITLTYYTKYVGM